MNEELDLRQKAIERIKTEEMLGKFRISAAKKQAQFYKVTRGTSPKVTKQSIEEEAQRLFSEWNVRHRKAPPSANVFEEVINLDESPVRKGTFECHRCYKTFSDQRKYAKHIATHYGSKGESTNAIMMAEKIRDRGLEHSSRRMSDAEKEDLRYFLNDEFQ